MSTYQGSPVVRSKFTQHGCSCCQCWCLAWLTLSPVCDRQPAVMEPSSSAPPPGSSARRAGPSSILPASTAAGTSELSLGTPSPSGQTPVMMKMMKMKVCPNTDLQIRKKSLFFCFFLSSFQDFDLQGSHRCSSDWMSISSYRSLDGLRVCGSSLPPPYVSTQDHVWIHFHSDSTLTGKGFRLSYVSGDGCSGEDGGGTGGGASAPPPTVLMATDSN